MKMIQKQSLSRYDEMPFYVAKPVFWQLHKGYLKVTNADQDRVYVITGREGLGKSTLAMQLAYTVDPNITIDNIVFTSDQLEKKIKSAQRFEAIIFDEAFNGLSSKGAISKENRRLVTLLMMCRQRNLFLFIVLPSFFLLEKYVAIFRSTALFNVLVSRKNFKLRYYKVYNYHDKKKLYILGKNLMDYSKPKIPKSFRFYGKLPPTINEDEYRQKKLDTFRDKGTVEEPEHIKWLKQRTILSLLLKNRYRCSYVEQAKALNDGGCPADDTSLSLSARDVLKKRVTSDA